ncbi:MAG: hypothetical protein E7Z92_04190 [Cyanobacteria bacterium SIG31]|nr:hypothetical protein [Cyanobacteria bacterium SIG31]
MISINTNLSSLITQRSLTKSTDALNLAIERMTTGFKINHAKDNAANYSISTNLTTKISSYMVAEENASMGLDMLNSANGSLDQITDKLERLRALATQANNGTYGAQSLEAINSEASALVDEINRLYSTAEYNGKKLFQASNEAQPALASTFNLTRTSSNEYGDFVSNPKTYSDEEVEKLTKFRDYLDGEAPEDTVYTISTARDFIDARCYGFDIDTTIVLANDIDLSTLSEEELEEFICSLNEGVCFNIDGNGHKISNLTIDCDEYDGFLGFFAYLDYSEDLTIKNVGLENINVLNADRDIGIFGAYNHGTVENCYAKGSIEVNGSGDNIGGLVNENMGLIKDCYADVIIETTDDVDGEAIGGLVGANWDGQIINSHSSGTIYAPNSQCVGGLVGLYFAEKDLINCYSTCDVTGRDWVGGLIGGGSEDHFGENAIRNCNLVNCYSTGDIIGNDMVGGLTSASLWESGISNCYTTGNVTAQYSAYGLAFHVEYNIENSYTTGNITAQDGAFGLAEGAYSVTNCYATGNITSGSITCGLVYGAEYITNCYTTGNVIGEEYVYGICDRANEINNCYSIGRVEAGSGSYVEGICHDVQSLTNCASVSNDSNADVLTKAEILARYTPEAMGYTADNGWTIVNGQPLLSWQKEAQQATGGGTPAGAINFQIGIHSNISSNITLNLGFALDGVNDLYGIGLDTTTDYLTKIDDLLSVVSNKATEYGAVQNRLESALDEIATQYENLVSTRSTIRDADIAEVSSQYIQQQILQQASATLMATANQTPAIALQLI